jgi:hypothetical protein
VINRGSVTLEGRRTQTIQREGFLWHGLDDLFAGRAALSDIIGSGRIEVIR